jgi:hypothetical protein
MEADGSDAIPAWPGSTPIGYFPVLDRRVRRPSQHVACLCDVALALARIVGGQRPAHGLPVASVTILASSRMENSAGLRILMGPVTASAVSINRARPPRSGGPSASCGRSWLLTSSGSCPILLLKVAEGLGRAIDQIPKRDRRTASPLSSAQRPMGQVFNGVTCHHRNGRTPPGAG